jgi:hypothetical protein
MSPGIERTPDVQSLTIKQKDEHTFSCSNCELPFSISLPDETARTSTSECEEVDSNSHSIKHEEQCQNCKHISTIYYCTNTHTLVEKGG